MSNRLPDDEPPEMEQLLFYVIVAGAIAFALFGALAYLAVA